MPSSRLRDWVTGEAQKKLRGGVRPLNVFVGWDSQEKVAYSVAAHSILSRASVPVSITALCLDQLPMWRAREGNQSTEFTYSRFLVPWLMGYEGLALFVDADVLFNCDVQELFDCYKGAAVTCVQHDYEPTTTRKFLDHVQEPYPRKNWSSVMLLDCAQCTILTPGVVNEASGKYLHRFEWTNSIGELPRKYNYLVGEQEIEGEAGVYHYTLGTPCFMECSHGPESDRWKRERLDMLSCADPA